MQILHKTSEVGGRPVALYNLDVVISVGYRVLVFALSVALSCIAVPAVTNAIPDVVSVTVATNAPAVKSTFANAAADKQLRHQCEAVTKSGNRCKRNSISGGKLCRQHQKIKQRNP